MKRRGQRRGRAAGCGAVGMEPAPLEVRVPEPTGTEADRVGRVLADWIREQRARRGAR